MAMRFFSPFFFTLINTFYWYFWQKRIFMLSNAIFLDYFSKRQICKKVFLRSRTALVLLRMCLYIYEQKASPLLHKFEKGSEFMLNSKIIAWRGDNGNKALGSLYKVSTHCTLSCTWTFRPRTCQLESTVILLHWDTTLKEYPCKYTYPLCKMLISRETSKVLNPFFITHASSLFEKVHSPAAKYCAV